MVKKETAIPKCGDSKLISKVSTNLQNLLNKYKIDYTTSDFSLLRRNIINNLSNVGIDQNNYDNKEYDKLKIYTMNLEINKVYNTQYGAKDTPKRKLGLLERFSD